MSQVNRAGVRTPDFSPSVLCLQPVLQPQSTLYFGSLLSHELSFSVSSMCAQNNYLRDV